MGHCKTTPCPPIIADKSRLRNWNWIESLLCQEPLKPTSALEPVPPTPCEFDPASPTEYLQRTIKNYFPGSLLMNNDDADRLASIFSGMVAQILAPIYGFSYLDEADGQTCDPNFLLYVAANMGLELENFLFNTTDSTEIAKAWREQIRTAVWRFKRKGTLSGMNQALHILNSGVRFDYQYETLEFNTASGMYEKVLKPYSEILRELYGAPVTTSCISPEVDAVIDAPEEFPLFSQFIDDRAAPCGTLGPNGSPGFSAYSWLPPMPVVDNVANIRLNQPAVLILRISEDGRSIVISKMDYIGLGNVLNCPVIVKDDLVSEVVKILSADFVVTESVCDTPQEGTVTLLLSETVPAGLGTNGQPYLIVPILSDGYLVKESSTGKYYKYDLATHSMVLVADDAEALCSLNLADANYAQTAQANIEIIFTENSILFNATTNAIDLSLKLIANSKPFHLTTDRYTVTFQLREELYLGECSDFAPTLNAWDILCRPSCCRYHFDEDSQTRLAEDSTCNDPWNPPTLDDEELVGVVAGGTIAGAITNTPVGGTIVIKVGDEKIPIAYDDGLGFITVGPYVSGGADLDMNDLNFSINLIGIADGTEVYVGYSYLANVAGTGTRTFSRDGCTPCDPEINANICWESCGVPTISGCDTCCEAVAWFADGECCKFFGSSKWGCDIGTFGEPHNCFDNCPDENAPTVYLPKNVDPATQYEFGPLTFDFGTGAFTDPLGVSIDTGFPIVVEKIGGPVFVQGVDYTISSDTITAISPALLTAGSVIISYTNKPKWVNTALGDPPPDQGQVDTPLWIPLSMTLLQNPDPNKRLHLAACRTPPELLSTVCGP